MDQIINFDDFYEEYRKNNFYNTFNKTINIYGIFFCLIIIAI